MEVIKMRTKILIGLVLLLSGFTFLAAGGVLAAKKARHRPPLILPVDGARPPEAYTGPSPIMYEGGKQPDCEDIHPTIGYEYVIQHDQWASTYYDYQKNGSMGRMIVVSAGGHRHMICHETRGPYDTFPRYITYNCKNPLDQWCGPLQIDGGPNNNAGYGNMLLLHDGVEVILYHRTAPPVGCWHSTLARGEYGQQCQCGIVKLYDIPDLHDHQATPGDNPGMWPKGCVVYDAEEEDYIHIATTESPPGFGDDQSIAYQRCYFDGDNLICCTPPLCGGPPPGPCYTRSPGATGDPDDSIAVWDTVKCISAVAVSSPVSKRVAIVYTKNRGDTQVNNDVFYIESTNNGQDWLNGTQWPPEKYNITNYPTEGSERAYTDVAACYDYNDSLHIIWNGCYYDSVGGYVTYDANLYHWSKEHGITMVAAGYWEDTEPGAWNRNVCKMSISAQDPIYHPGGDPDSVYLFCTWTQFNPGDISLGGMSNGDIYAAVSIDGGQCWTVGENLTNTQTPDCEPGECLSEHWSSLAENMYDGDLHIEYVCDRDAGGIVRGGSAWTDNPMMYLHLEWGPPRPCGVSIKILDPPDWCNPPVKVAPGEGRVIAMELTGIYTGGGDYEVTTDDPNVAPTLNGDGYLSPGEQKRVELTIFCPGEESFLDVTVYVHYCIWTEEEGTLEIKLHVVQSEDYYECDRDWRTWIQKDNCTLKLWACVNTSQEVWDKRIADEDRQKVIFSGGVIVATTADNDTVVGRQDCKDVFTGARDTINVVQGYDYSEPECNIQKIHVKDTYIWTPHLDPPNNFKWWWIDIHKQIILFHDRPGYPPCPEWKKEQVIKSVWIDYSASPVWWPDPGVYEGHEDIYLGVFADIDAPWDEGCNGCNVAGYDYDRQMIWQRGWWNGQAPPDGHPEYEDHYVGLALTNPAGARVEPYGCQNVLNEDYLYPQDDWGWLNGELYQLAATPGVNIHYPDSVADRAVVLTAEMIPAGTDTAFESEFILIEASIAGDPGIGLAELQAHIDDTRNILIPELNELGLFSKEFPICGDCNVDTIVNVGDLVFLATYLFLNGPPPSWPMNRADVNNDGAVNVGDLVFLATYLFQNGPPPDCSGFGRE
jgi:hypothetical protein